MKRLNNIIPKYLVFAFPTVLVMFAWGFFQDQQGVLSLNNRLVYAVWNALAFHLMLWLAVFIYFIFILLLSPSFRDEFLAKLVRIKERDERESQIIGRVGRFSFLSTLALLVFLLFFSTINVSVTRLPAERAVDGKRHSLSIGMSFLVFEKNACKNAQDRNPDTFTYSTQSLLFSKQVMLLALIAWHLGSFYYLSRKYRRSLGAIED